MAKKFERIGRVIGIDKLVEEIKKYFAQKIDNYSRNVGEHISPSDVASNLQFDGPDIEATKEEVKEAMLKIGEFEIKPGYKCSNISGSLRLEHQGGNTFFITRGREFSGEWKNEFP